MKASTIVRKERGFFAAGVALIVLAVFGIPAATVVTVLDEGQDSTAGQPTPTLASKAPERE